VHMNRGIPIFVMDTLADLAWCQQLDRIAVEWCSNRHIILRRLSPFANLVREDFDFFRGETTP
jgi:hypothetical protein